MSRNGCFCDDPPIILKEMLLKLLDFVVGLEELINFDSKWLLLHLIIAFHTQIHFRKVGHGRLFGCHSLVLAGEEKSCLQMTNVVVVHMGRV